MNKKILQKYICRTFRNMFAELLKIYSLCLRKYVCWCCSGRRLRSGTEGNNIYAERSALTASHKPLARSTFSTDRSFHRTVFFWSRLIFEEGGSKVIEDPLLTFADAGNLVEVVLGVVVEVGSVPLVFQLWHQRWFQFSEVKLMQTLWSGHERWWCRLCDGK